MYTSVIREDFDDNIIDMTFMLTNKCNYTCTYCIEKIPQNKCKAQFLDLRKTIDFVKRYIAAYSSMKINVRIYGGEPTLHPDIVEFCKTVSDFQQVQIVEIFTNFSTSIKQFNELLNIDKLHLFISYHTNAMMNNDQFFNKLFSLSKEHLNKITCNIMLENIDEDYFNATYNLYKKIIKTKIVLSSKMLVELVPLFSTSNYVSNYSSKQMTLLNNVIKFHNTKIKFRIMHDSKEEIVSKVVGYHSFNFNNWQCTSGKNAIFVDTVGDIYPCGGLYTKRYVIYKNVKMKNIFNDKLEDMFTYTLCPHSSCVLCVPMIVKNTTNIDKSIVDADNKFNI